MFQPEHEEDEVLRTISGAVVAFAEGGCVSKIALPWEFSAVMLNGISASSSKVEVSTLLRDLGYQVSSDSIQILPALGAATTRARVTVEDRDFAKAVCSRLKSTAESDQPHGVVGSPTPPKLPGLTLTRRISCKKVLISWNKAFRLAWLNFGSSGIAQRVSDKFNEGKFQICGHVVSAGKPTGSLSSRNPVSWTVVLKSVPSYATTSDVEDAVIATYDKPRHVELGKASNVYDVETAPALIESLLTQIGRVDFKMRDERQGKRFKAVAVFAEEIEAREAVKSLHDQPQSFLNHEKLTLQLMSSSKFKIPARIHDYIRHKIEAHVPVWREQHLAYREYPDPGPQRNFVTVKIEGERVKDVAGATNTLEMILAGKTIDHEGAAFWAPLLANTGPAYQTLKQIEQEHGILLVRDKVKRRVKFFGPDTRFTDVQKLLIGSLQMLPNSTHTLELNDDQFAWTCRGGFKELSLALGGDVVSFDVVSKPKRITVTGSHDQYRRAVDILKNHQDATSSKPILNEEQDCSVCWTPAENPVVLQCQHPYCADCFEGLCTSADSSGKDFELFCQGDMGNCGKVLPLTDLKQHLSSEALEEVLEASFSSFLRRRPQEFRYCPTPECGNVYRASSTSRSHTCCNCLEVTCTLCHEQHETLTCAEFKDLASGGYEAFQRAKKELGIKDCPKCKTAIEKTYGCNHMTCGGCGTHICWVCLETFSASSPCYAHMSAEHGGVFNVEDLLQG